MYEALAQQYASNEDNNFHYENNLLLANNFGSEEDRIRAEKYLTALNEGKKEDLPSISERLDFSGSLWAKSPSEFIDTYLSLSGQDD